jgi:hypothetical protein
MPKHELNESGRKDSAEQQFVSKHNGCDDRRQSYAILIRKLGCNSPIDVRNGITETVEWSPVEKNKLA